MKLTKSYVRFYQQTEQMLTNVIRSLHDTDTLGIKFL